MIETDRLLLCRPKDKDMLTLKKLWQIKQVRKYLGGALSEETIDQKQIEIQNHWDLYGFGLNNIYEKVHKHILGLCGLHYSKDGVELSYMVFPKYWGKGFAREASRACLDYGFKELKLKKIISITQQENLKSCTLLKNIGMQNIANFERFEAVQCLFAINKP